MGAGGAGGIEMSGRIAAGAIAAVGIAALAAQAAVLAAIPPFGTALSVLWRLAGYFTILTNALVTAHFVAIAAGGRVGAVRAGGLVAWIGLVGVVYHLLLADLRVLDGLAWWADQGLHTAMPVLVALWWWAHAPATPLPWRAAAHWAIWPLVYCAYALVRGAATGFYPYPFLDAGALGYGGVAVRVAGMAAAFVAGGLGLVALSRLRR
ncbi:MAG: Pr6Pr family membrane protein [Gemmobacter sp.]